MLLVAIFFFSGLVFQCGSVKQQSRYERIPGLLDARLKNFRTLRCPRRSAIAVVDVREERAYCRRNPKLLKRAAQEKCKWKQQCIDADTSNKKETEVGKKSGLITTEARSFDVARGVRFKNNAIRKARKDVELYCCKARCKKYKCKKYVKERQFMMDRLHNDSYVNSVEWLPRRKVGRVEFCEPKCVVVKAPKDINRLRKTCAKKDEICATNGDCCEGNCKPWSMTCDCADPGNPCIEKLVPCCKGICTNGSCPV